MYREILFPVTGSEGDAAALDVACAMARERGAHLSVLRIVSFHQAPTTRWVGVPDIRISQALAQWRDRSREEEAQLQERIRQQVGDFDFKVVESLTEEPAHILGWHAIHSDLVVMAAPAGQTLTEAVVESYFSALLLGSGRPVLVVPRGAGRFALPVRQAALAWQPRRESARALHDGLALVDPAGTIDVLSIRRTADIEDGSVRSVEAIARAIRQHGRTANARHHECHRTDSIASSLLHHAEVAGAGLLIAGGYGHSRLREWVLGGVTLDLLRNARMPLLFSH